MKKSLVALAVLAAAGAASAQSSVTLFGIVDASVGHISGSNGGASRTYMGNSGLNSSRLGFRGVEDLGGGLAASFWLEGALGNDDGTAGQLGTGGFDFRRRSTVSLSGNFGEVRLGRDLTPTHHNDDVFSPFGTVGVGANVVFTALNSASGFAANPNQVRASNSIGYFLPSNLGGFYGQAMYALAENTTGTTTLEQLIHNADQALYRAKHGGRDRVVCARGAGQPEAGPSGSLVVVGSGIQFGRHVSERTLSPSGESVAPSSVRRSSVPPITSSIWVMCLDTEDCAVLATRAASRMATACSNSRTRINVRSRQAETTPRTRWAPPPLRGEGWVRGRRSLDRL